MQYFSYKYRKGNIINIFQNPEASAASYIAGKVTHIDEGAEIFLRKQGISFNDNLFCRNWRRISTWSLLREHSQVLKN